MFPCLIKHRDNCKPIFASSTAKFEYYTLLENSQSLHAGVVDGTKFRSTNGAVIFIPSTYQFI
jgi:hypothetical protein